MKEHIFLGILLNGHMVITWEFTPNWLILTFSFLSLTILWLLGIWIVIPSSYKNWVKYAVKEGLCKFS